MVLILTVVRVSFKNLTFVAAQREREQKYTNVVWKGRHVTSVKVI